MAARQIMMVVLNQNNMIIEKTSLEGVLLIKPEPIEKGQGEISRDERGEFVEAYNGVKYKANGITVEFVEDDISVSKKKRRAGHAWG